MTTGQIRIRIEGQLVQTLQIDAPIISIGRTPDNILSLPHPLVARQHAELRIGAQGATITDLGSSSGTFIGAVRLLPHQPQALPAGAMVRIGPFEITVEGEGFEAADGGAHGGASGGEHETRPTVVAVTEPPRPTYAPPKPLGPLSRYLIDLPVIYHDSDFLGRFLMIFEALLEPIEQRQDHIAMYFDPATCPAEMLPWLAGWLSIPLDRRGQESRLRALLAEALDLYRWRGTRYGLARMIELSLGVTPEISDEPNQSFIIRIKIHASAEQPLDRRVIEDVITAHKPAHVGYILDYTEA